MREGTRPKILFVDDDPQLLAGLRSVLRVDRDRWDMAFVPGATAALAELAAQPFDAVVSDMRMPGLDGAELLALVRERAPGTRRVILSGSADADDAQRANAIADEVLTKPCPVRELRAAIEKLLKR
jgi:CheY-like chemotaxis protein